MPLGGARSAMGMCKMEYILTDNESIVASCLRLGGNVPENYVEVFTCAVLEVLKHIKKKPQ